MNGPAVNLKLMDGSTAVRELNLASELFHRINRIIPVDQVVLQVSPSCRVRDAVALMKQHGYRPRASGDDQLPPSGR